MRVVSLFLLLLLLYRPVLAQQEAAPPGTFRIDSIPANGLTLRLPWCWHAGDNPAWASPDFNDSRWDTIRPDQYITKLPQVREAEIGWLRLAFSVDSALTNRPLAFSVQQVVASEIYLDGHLLHRFGRVSRQSDQEQTRRTTPVENVYFVLQRAGTHQLAVRISHTRQNRHFPMPLPGASPVFGLRIMEPALFVNQGFLIKPV